jgi:NAD-dependent dihydropyrimidine dehydrogenase PreA subunit
MFLSGIQLRARAGSRRNPMAVRVDQEQCSGCGACVDVCVVEALVLAHSVVTVLQDQCIDCGACLDECPTGALSLDQEGASAAPIRQDLGAI